MAARPLLAVARESEDILDVLHVFRDKLPGSGSHITAIMAKLQAVSSLLHALDNASQHPQYAGSAHRISHDVALVTASLQQTNQAVLDNVGRTRRMSYGRVWGDLAHHMEEREGVGFHKRLLWYVGLLKAGVDVLQENLPTIDPEILAQSISELLQAQVNLNGRLPGTAATRSPELFHTSPVQSPDRPRFVFPVAPDPPLSPLSPTWTADSTMTLDSSHTSYSGMGSAPSTPPGHWAREVFDGFYPSTPFRRGYDTGKKSQCHGDRCPNALQMLHQDGFQRALELQFDAETSWVRLYYRPSDRRARILFLSSKKTFHCVPLTQLIAIRGTSDLRLCRVRSDGVLDSWALLNFAIFERMALFYSTFVAMKRQDIGVTIDDRLIEEPKQFHETMHFHGMIRHDNMIHALRLWQDVPSGVYRLEATALRRTMVNVPIWTAFITKYKERGDVDWATLQPGTSQVLLAAFRPEPYVFLDNYCPPRRGHDWVLNFVGREGEWSPLYGRLLTNILDRCRDFHEDMDQTVPE